MKKKGQHARENRKLAHLNNNRDFFFFGWEIRVFLLV